MPHARSSFSWSVFTLSLITLALGVAAFGCSGEAGPAPVGGDGGPGPASNVHGTIGGTPFVFTSGYGFFDPGASTSCSGSDCTKSPAISLVLSSDENACAGAMAGKAAAGATYVQIFGLGTAPGDFTSTETKAAVIAPTCASGAPIRVSASFRTADAAPAKVTLTRADGSFVAGTLEVRFSDGSSLQGSFSLPMCGASLDEKAVCL